MNVKDMAYRQAIIDLLDKQTHKGLLKYGKPIDKNPLDIVTRLEYIQEELIDGLVYIEHVKQWFTEKEKSTE